MDFNNYKIKYIQEEEFLSYIDWLTRFKNPFLNFLRTAQKIITKNSLEPKINTKKFEEMYFEEKVCLTKYIWEKSLENLLGTKKFSENKLKNFLIFEEEQTFNTDYLLDFLKYQNTQKPIQNYTKMRAEVFLPIDELVEYFAKQDNKPNFLKRLIEKKNSNLTEQELYEAQTPFASTKVLFLVEGITEEKILPIFAQKEGIDFETNGIKLKSAGGKTHLLKYYAQIRKLLKIPVFILLDADGQDIITDLNNILEKKDRVYLISKGEIEDILPHELIIRAINNYFSTQGAITENDLNKNEPMAKILYNLYKEKGFGEFHKAKFAQILKENIISKEDAKGEIENILKLIQSK
ncbi:MAG: ATP-dependent endonuclease [bacterium]|nr:ATP-dependent endonuclease [bacterium]